MRYVLSLAIVVGLWQGVGARGAVAPLEDVIVYECRRVPAPPRIDGRLDEAAWSRVPAEPILYKFLAQTPEPAGSHGTFRLGFDARHLYLGIMFDRAGPVPLKQGHLGHDDPDLWMDDSAEIYVDPKCDGQFYKLIVNSLGVLTDFQQTSAGIDYSWEATGAKVAARVYPRFWTIEMSVPWRAMGMSGPPRRLIGFEVLRFSGPRETWASWTVGASYGHPEKFGYLSFGGGVMGHIRTLVRSVEASKGSAWQIVTRDGVMQYRSLRITLDEALQHARAQVLTTRMDIHNVPDDKTRRRLTGAFQAVEAALAEAEKTADAGPLTGSRLRSALLRLSTAVTQARELSFDARIDELLAQAGAQ